jgi:hypothetical protein
MVPTQESSKKFRCEICHYYTSRKSQYDRHLLTDKHQILQNPTCKKFQSEKTFKCECGNAYKHSSTLYSHKKICKFKTSLHDILNKDELIIEILKQNAELIKENNEFKNIVMKTIENGTVNHGFCNNNTIQTNSHNKSFNLNFFLNETCKNAMNITEFVESIKLQLKDLIDVGELGFVEGISNIIVNNLNKLDETIRPIHCTDKKRETFYVKDEGQWEKEDQERKKITGVIKTVAYKNERLLQLYREEHPGCNYCESKYSDEYSKLVIEAMGGSGNNNREKEDKIISNISKATVIHEK